MNVETKLGGDLLCEPHQLLFQYTSGNLCVLIEDVKGIGWKSKVSSQQIPEDHVWNAPYSLNCSFTFEQLNYSAGATHSPLSCALHIYQVDGDQQTLFISTESRKSPRTAILSSNGHLINNFRLSATTKKHLCSLLDVPQPRGNDWRMLAQRLAVDRYATYFTNKISPTEQILQLWEARQTDTNSVGELMNCLRVMGRTDAAALIEKEAGAWL
ncbi:unnamed protein product [Dimorphilus gyrociliatus]|uniref:Death domain-containing protein n=1 Tax=Dimorphilus gyrociliatus TaxID=2664684 RepID=A0A7I8W135_9ANNE|nr:unnamed protein product [Dimorphilus gyrociliatus]